MTKELKNKPLVEAILELRWQLQGTPPQPPMDPHYKLLLGRFFDRFFKDYPEHEQLPTASIPDELVGHIVQHRFRAGQNLWPLVQLGPGIFSLNSTADYTWSDFCPRALSAVSRLYEAHPKPSDLRISNVILRYIDAVEFDYQSDDTFDFLRDKLKLSISLPPTLFNDTGIENRSETLTFQCSFRCEKPKGILNIRFATGQKSNSPAIIWETTVESAGKDVPDMPNGFDDWIVLAHEITHDWFFKMIGGELEGRFSHE